MNPGPVFHAGTFHAICDQLAKKDRDLRQILDAYGYPPLWSREPGFETLLRIILEQQVSLASANAAFGKLQAAIGSVQPGKILLLSDQELKACSFSRQKTGYARNLAAAVCSGDLKIAELCTLSDTGIRNELKKIKGIGDWTAAVYMMLSLHRSDLFPSGDLALVKSIREVKKLDASVPADTLAVLVESWKPYRTIAAYLLWHQYLSRRGIRTG